MKWSLRNLSKFSVNLTSGMIMQENYKKALECYEPFVIGTPIDKMILKGSRPLPTRWVRNRLKPGYDERFIKPEANMCDYIAFHKPKLVPCNAIPMDVDIISQVLVESTNRYSLLFKDKSVRCGICKNYPM